MISFISTHLTSLVIPKGRLAVKATVVRGIEGLRKLFLKDWAASSAEFLKSLDPHHLLTIGTEGFLGGMTPGK